MLAVCWYLGWDAGRNRSQWLIVRGPSRKECNQRTVNLYPVKSQCLLGVRSYTNVLETSSQCPILTRSYSDEKLYFDGKVIWWLYERRCVRSRESQVDETLVRRLCFLRCSFSNRNVSVQKFSPKKTRESIGWTSRRDISLFVWSFLLWCPTSCFPCPIVHHDILSWLSRVESRSTYLLSQISGWLGGAGLIARPIRCAIRNHRWRRASSGWQRAPPVNAGYDEITLC